MVTESTKKLVGNDAFEGYAIDLISEIAQILKFNYTFKWVDDGAYGYKNKETGEWNGLMGEILTQVGPYYGTKVCPTVLTTDDDSVAIRCNLSFSLESGHGDCRPLDHL